MSRNYTTKPINQGVYNAFDDEDIPRGAASDSLNWITRESLIELRRGTVRLGAEETDGDPVRGLHVGYRDDGTAVLFRKINTKVQYYNTTTEAWVDTITGLTDGTDFKFTNYFSTAGAFTFLSGSDGLFKICTANPGDYIDQYDAATNYIGKIAINESRTFLWDRDKDPTGLYLSYVDSQKYDVIDDESVGSSGSTNYTGTLDIFDDEFTVTIASPAVVTYVGHGFHAGSEVVFATTGALPTGMTAGTTYYVISTGLTDDTFQFSATPGGSAVNTSGVQSGTHTLTPGRRTCFGIEMTDGTLVVTDDRNGNLIGDVDPAGTNTINYTTGAFDVTFSTTTTGAVVVDYSYENSNSDGVTDFTFSSPRTAGEGDVIRQDEGGDAILAVLPYNGSYYSIKKRSIYELFLSNDDTDATNIVVRRGVGIKNWRSAVATGKGIFFIDTSNEDEPELRVLDFNPNSDSIGVRDIVPQFKFESYNWDDCVMDTWGEYIIFSGRTLGDQTTNNRLFMYHVERGSLDILDFKAFELAKGTNTLYMGESISENVVELFTGFDDEDCSIPNYWEGKADDMGQDRLKKHKYLRIRGQIATGGIIKVYVQYDNGAFTQVGTIRWDGPYVDRGNPFTIGSSMVGSAQIGGEDDGNPELFGWPFLHELKIRQDKFRIRKVKFEAEGFAYVAIESIMDRDVRLFSERLPKRYRAKQNESIDGVTYDLDSPE